MEQSNGRRKACDRCYNKRVRCDAKSPRCSTCEVYDADCTYQATSRPSNRQPGRARKQDAVESRIDKLERQLKLVTERVGKLESDRDQPTSSIAPIAESEDFLLFESSPQTPQMELPAQDEVLSAVERYLEIFNCALPLFDPGILLRMVRDWYSLPNQRDSVTWAAINVILALAQREVTPTDRSRTMTIAELISNAQSVLTGVSSKDVDLLTVQATVGLVMLYQGVQDLGPATMLIATALRLAHRIGLHRKQGSQHLDPNVALQHDRVFWIAYILDRDISLRTKQPPIQNDDEIDLDLPPTEPTSDGLGFVFHPDGSSKMNFLRVRLQLARIQGEVYNSLFSTSAQKLDPAQRTQAMARIDYMLAEWSFNIPFAFSADALCEINSTALMRSFGIVYATRLACLALVNRADSWDSRWLNGLQVYGRKAVAGEEALPILLPRAWQTLVVESRNFMKLFLNIPQKDAAFIWMTACPCISAMICLTANNMCTPTHQTTQSDTGLIHTAMHFLNEMVRQTENESLRIVRDACSELIQNADIVTQQNSELYQVVRVA